MRTLKELSTGKKLLLLTLLGLFIRLYVVFNAASISVDGIGYVALAREFAEGEGGWKEWFNVRRPPLYPLLLAFTSFLFHDYELSGRIVSLVFGTLVIPVGFHIGKHVYSERAGLITAAFIAIHPYLIRYSGDVLTEALYYFLAAMTALMGLKAVSAGSVRFMLAAGAFSALAYLTKPAGIGFLIVISLWVAFSNLRGIREDWQKRLLLLASGWAAFIVLALPYLLFLYNELGNVAISGRVGVGAMITRGHGHGAMWFTKKLGHLTTFSNRLPEAVSFPFAFFFLLYLLKIARTGIGRAERYIASIVASFFLLYIWVSPRRRYLVQLMPLALVFPAIGFDYFRDWLKGLLGSKALPVMAVVVVLMLYFQLDKGLEPLHSHHLPERLAGEYLRDEYGGGAAIISTMTIVGFYAEGTHVKLSKRTESIEALVEYGEKKGAKYLAGYRSRLNEKIPGFKEEDERKEGKLLLELKSFKGEKRGEFVVYRLTPVE